LSLGAIALSRQFGVRITVEQLEKKISQGQIKSEKELKNTLKEQGVKVQRLKPSLKTLIDRSYYFPCVALMRDGSARILISCSSNAKNIVEFQSIDPLDPTSKVNVENEAEFRRNWVGSVYLISSETGIASQDRIFDWTWFIPELYRFKGLLALTFIAAVLTAILGLAPIVFIQISLDKVLNFGAVSTLYILVMGVCAALIFNGILGYVRDYVINFISTSIEARLSGDIFDKVMAMPAATFQTGSSSEFEAILLASGKIKAFISTQILKTIFDATTILVFLPVLFGYSPVLALIVTFFSMAVGPLPFLADGAKKKLGRSQGP